MPLRLVLVSLFVLFLLNSCGRSLPEVENFHSAIISTRSPSFVFEPENGVALDPVARLRLPGQPEMQLFLQESLTRAINSELIKRKFPSHTTGKAGYWLGYAIIVDSELSDAELTTMFGIAPGYAGGTRQSYQRGTLLLDLHDGNRQATLWRAALQTRLVDNLSNAERKTRIEVAVRRLFDAFERDVQRMTN